MGSKGQTLELDNPRGDVVAHAARQRRPDRGHRRRLARAADLVRHRHRRRRRDGRGAAFTAAKLHDHFAVAVSGTNVIPVPVVARVMIYRRRASPLHAARAAVAIAWCAALAVAALIESNPVVLGAVTLSVVLAGALAGVGRELRRSLLWAIPLCVHDRRDQRAGDAATA